jgi:hypothetical protein
MTLLFTVFLNTSGVRPTLFRKYMEAFSTYLIKDQWISLNRFCLQNDSSEWIPKLLGPDRESSSWNRLE